MLTNLTQRDSAVYFTLISLMAACITAIGGLVLARYLGVSDYGRYATAVAFLGVVGMFSNIGAGQVFVRDVTRDPGTIHRRAARTLTVVLTATVLAWLSSIVVASFSGYDNATFVFIVVYGLHATVLIGTINIFFRAVFQVTRTLVTFSIIHLAGQLAYVAFIVVGAMLGFHLINFALVSITSSLITIVLIWMFVEPRVNARLDFSGMGPLMKESIPFGLSNMLTVVYMQAGLVVLSYLVSVGEVGLFAVAYKVVVLTYLLPSALYAVILPRGFELGGGGSRTEELSAFVQRFFRLVYVCGLPISLMIFIYAADITDLLLGNAYAESARFLKLMSVLVLLRFISFPSALILTSTDQQSTRTLIQASVSVISIIFAFLSISFFGVVGLAYALILSDIMLAGMYYLFSKRSGVNLFSMGDIVKPSLAAVFMAILSHPLNLLLPFWLNGPILFVLYVVLLYKWNYFKEIEITHLSSVLRLSREND